MLCLGEDYAKVVNLLRKDKTVREYVRFLDVGDLYCGQRLRAHRGLHEQHHGAREPLPWSRSVRDVPAAEKGGWDFFMLTDRYASDGPGRRHATET